MLRTLSITVVLVALFAAPAVTSAQDNSGIDAYTEGAPSAGGNGGSGGGSSGASDGSGTASGAGTGADASVGSGAGGAPGSSGSLTEREAARLADGTSPGELPATGLDETGLMAVVGALLLLSGLALRRLSPREG